MSIQFKDNSAAVKAALSLAEQRLLSRWGIRGTTNIMQEVPVDTGLTRSGAGHDVKSADKAVLIGVRTEYAPKVQLGTYKQRANPFMDRAIKNKIDDFRQDAEKELGAIK